MATNRKEMLCFEFAEDDTVVGTATWMGPGLVELDFKDPTLRSMFDKHLASPGHSHGLVAEGAHHSEVWPDETKSHFAEACLSFTGLYRVRRVL